MSQPDNELNTRALVLNGLINVVIKGRSSSEVIPSFHNLTANDRALASELFLGTLHHYFELAVITKRQLKRPLKQQDQDILLCLVLGLYQLIYTRIPDHAAIHETVNLCHELKKPWAAGILNAIFRKIQRKPALATEIQLADYDKFNLPKWLFLQIQEDWGQAAGEWLDNNHIKAPLTLRINSMKSSRDEYLKLLSAEAIEAEAITELPHAIRLAKSCDITTLPGYEEGLFSVQDSAAQWAATLLAPKPGDKILDACAAPGGKTTHILELVNNECDLVALDNVPDRLDRMSENLHRLDLSADLRCGDAIKTEDWLQDGETFDRILCDAPCSATGIIRRHPDIGIHRTAKDVKQLNQTQWRIMKSLWQCLKPGGILLYSTCSVLKSENENLITDFLNQNPDAKLVPIENIAQGFWQIFPGQDGMDGFFYARLTKA